jgi:N-acyl-D-aspartate/D-glutamate deacylase
MGASVLVCGAVFDGVSEELGDRTEILVRDGRIADIARSVDRPDGAEVVDSPSARSVRDSSTRTCT